MDDRFGLNTELKPCPFCGCNKLTMSVNGGILPAIMDEDERNDIWENTPLVTTCELYCNNCGAMIEGYAASNNSEDDIYDKAIENCVEKWNRRAI